MAIIDICHQIFLIHKVYQRTTQQKIWPFTYYHITMSGAQCMIEKNCMHTSTLYLP